MATKMWCFVLIFCLFHKAYSDDPIWYSYQLDSGYGNREELVIEKVQGVGAIKTEEPILKWKSLSLKQKCYAIGLSENGLTVSQAVLHEKDKEAFAINSTYTPMNATILDAFIFEDRVPNLVNSEVYVIVATKSDKTAVNSSVDISWFKISEDNKLIQLHKWDWRKNMTHMNIFCVDTKYYLLICNDRSDRHATVDIYEFQLGGNLDFWFFQKIVLQQSIQSTAISYFEADVYLSIPQDKDVKIYKFQQGRFQFHSTLSARNVTIVAPFKIGFQNYLSVDGYDAGVYKFVKQGLVKQTIQDANLDGIDYWLSIPIRTYRDEEILISERSLDHSSHKSFVIEVILYNGGKFMVHDEMTCDYYGEKSHGMNCLVEEDSTRGIKGSAFIILDNALGIIIPGKKLSSRIFMIHTEMKEIESPLEMQVNVLKQRKEFLQEKLNAFKKWKYVGKMEKGDLIKNRINIEDSKASQIKSEPVLRLSESNNIELINDAGILDSLLAKANKISGLINIMNDNIQNYRPTNLRGNMFENLIVTGPVEVRGLGNIEQVLTPDFNNNFKFDSIFGFGVGNEGLTKKFHNINIDSIKVNEINGAPVNFITERNGTIELSGDIQFSNVVSISENVVADRVNGVPLESAVVEADKTCEDPLLFETISSEGTLNTTKINKFPVHTNYLDSTTILDGDETENLQFDKIPLPGNVTVKNINGIDVDPFLTTLYFTNVDSDMPGKINIEGEIESEKMYSNYLNNLSFPDDFVISSNNDFREITGAKIFEGEVKIHEMFIIGKINNQDSNSFVTLRNNQNIFKNFTFDNLKVTDNLNVTGKVNGLDMKNITHLTLKDTNRITNDATFKSLHVEGNIIIHNIFNGTDFFEILEDVVYKTKDSEKINSIKIFNNGLSVRSNLILESKLINDISLDSLINKENDQTIESHTLNGIVSFENLNVVGTYDGINIEKLEQDTMKLSGEQFITSNLIFENDIIANDLDVQKTLNSIENSDYLYSGGDRLIKSSNFNVIKVQNLDILGNFETNIENFDILNFNNRKLSYTRNQTIKNGTVQQSRIYDISPTYINSYEYINIFGTKYYAEKIRDLMEHGRIRIKELHVEDSINVSSVNGILMANILQNCMWTKKDVTTDLKLQGDTEFRSIEVEYFNDVLFDDFKNSIIFKNETNDLVIFGPKMYQNGFDVSNYITCPLLNNIPVKNILRITGDQIISSPIEIDGDVLLNGNTQINYLGETPIELLEKTFKSIDKNTYMIEGDVGFTRACYVDNFYVDNNINGMNISFLLENLVNVNLDEEIPGQIIFRNNVTFANNLAVESNINGIDLNSYKENIVLTTQDFIVEGSVEFTEDVSIMQELNVELNLNAPILLDFYLQNWINNGVFINFGKIPGTLHFVEGSIAGKLITASMNNIQVKSLIPLNTEQDFNQDLLLNELICTNDIIVGHFVNGRILPDEFYNTAMIDRIQEITSIVIFNNNVLIRKLLDISNTVNDHNIVNIVTTDTEQILNAIYKFENRTSVNSALNIHGLINGGDFSLALEQGLKVAKLPKQLITRPWTVEHNLLFNNNVLSSGNISNLNLRNIANQVEERRIFKTSIQGELLDQFNVICKDINEVVDASRKQIYLFQYFDDLQHIEFSSGIENIHHFEYQNLYYTLVSETGSCSASLFVWSNNMLIPIKTIEIGRISQMITVRNGDVLFLVTRNHNVRECKNEGINLWKFTPESLIVRKFLQQVENYISLEESLVPGTFYAMGTDEVVEYRVVGIEEPNIYKVRKWLLNTENSTFTPRGFKIGLALRNGDQIIKLSRDVQVDLDNLSLSRSEIILGNVTWFKNDILPGKSRGQMLTMNVGYPRRKILTAISSRKHTSVRGKTDSIKIYEDVMSGVMYHKISAYKPASILSIEFGENGETLLMFLENRKILQVYEYKGIEGFKHKTSVNMRARKLIHFVLPFGKYQKPRNVVGIVQKNRLILLLAVMEGEQVLDDKLECAL